MSTIITPISEAGAGRASHIAAQAFNAREVLAALRNGSGNLELIGWNTGPGGSTLMRGADSGQQAGTAQEVVLTLIGRRAITAVRSGSGNLLLISWDVPPGLGTINRRSDSGSAAGEASQIAMSAMSDTMLVTALRNGSGNLLLISWRLGPDGTISRLDDSGSQAGEVSLVTIAAVNSNNVITGVRNGSGNLELIGWNVSDGDGSIQRWGQSAEAGEVREIACLPIAGGEATSTLVTSVQDGSGNLLLIAWQFSAQHGTIERVTDSGSAAGKASHIAICSTATPPSNNQIIIVSMRRGDGNFELIAFDLAADTSGAKLIRIGDMTNATRVDVTGTALVSLEPGLIMTAYRGNRTLRLTAYSVSDVVSTPKGCPPYSQPSRWERLDEKTPVVSSRQWTTALSPRPDGEWNFIGQSYPGQHDPDPVDQYVVQLDTGKTTITKTDREGYCDQALSIENQLRSANGKIWFPGHAMFLSWYDPADESIHELPRIVDSAHPQVPDVVFYTHQFGPDGILYLGTQSTSRLPTIWAVDTTTNPPTVTRKGAVGEKRNPGEPTNYCYYIAPDTSTGEKWIYVCVGENPWELAALNLSTGFMKVLPPSVPSNGYIKFEARNEGWVVTKYDPNITESKDRLKRYWCIDGAIEHEYIPGFDPATLPFTARSVKAAAAPLTSHPKVDASAGVGLVKWQSPMTGLTEVHYTVTNKRPQNIESLTTLADGTVLGNANQYQGFFRYTPRTHEVEWYGNWADGLSQPNVLVHNNGIVYLAGYPNCALYAYRPSEQWKPPMNPILLGYYHATNRAKYNSFLGASGSRIYSTGRGERDDIGTGVGYYTIGGTFTGKSPGLAGLTDVHPQGLIVDDGVDGGRVVLSTKIIDSNASSSPSEAQLIVYNLDLLELARYTVMPGLKDTGALFKSDTPGVLIVLSRLSKLIYRFDIVQGALLAYKDLPFVVDNSWQDPATGCIYIVVGPHLHTVDKATLDLLPLTSRPEIEQLDELIPNRFCVSGTKFIIASKSNLYMLGDI